MVHTAWCLWLSDLDTGYQYHIPPITAGARVWERGPRVIRDDISSSDPGGWRSLSFSIIPTSDRD